MASGDNLKGKRMPGSGRAPGTKNIKSLLIEDILNTPRYVELLETSNFISPISFWIDILQDTTLQFEPRNEAAKNLAKYLHRAQPQLVENTILTDTSEGFVIKVVKNE